MISSKNFTVDARAKMMISDMSVVEKHFSRAYPDSADISFKMISDRTGKIAKFVHIDSDHNDEDGSLASMVFAVVDREELYSNPSLKGWKVVIYNT